MTLFKTAYLKIDRAQKHVSELNALLNEQKPFRYVLETDTVGNLRSTFAEKDEPVIDQAAIIGGDALQTLRSALDHAYWTVVSPHVASEKSQKAIQFPFSRTETRLEDAVRERLAERVSPEFFRFIVSLQPHGGRGGNGLLYLLHDQNNMDKHRTLIPTADYKSIDATKLRRLIPDLPAMIQGNTELGGNGRDMGWPLSPHIKREIQMSVGSPGRFVRQELNVPVRIVFKSTETGRPLTLVPTLHEIAHLVREIVNNMERFL